MAALILDGKALAKTTEEELSARVAKLKEKTGKTPWPPSWWATIRPAPRT